MHFPNLLHVIPEKWRKTAAWAALALLAAALLFNAFAGLGAAEIRNWDEARHAISAWEMLNGGNLLVNTFRFEPDYWNVKPVLRSGRRRPDSNFSASTSLECASFRRSRWC